jgi:DNA (cytosine-5)-methyltransferase 1
MASKPRLLDTFCCAAACAVGYSWAGFDVSVGIDIEDRGKDYPFDFIQSDALDYLDKYGHEYDFIHASPPCQQHSVMRHITKKDYADFIAPCREILQSLGLPYVIENTPKAPLRYPILLRGDMFTGLLVKRERIFECSFNFEWIPATPTKALNIPKATKGASPTTGFVSIVGTGGLGNGLGVEYARMAMNTAWMPRALISQAVPPNYTQWIGAYWLEKNGFDFTYPAMNVPPQKIFGGVQ